VMLDWMLNKRVIVKRYNSELGEYNRPKKNAGGGRLLSMPYLREQ